MADDSPRRAGTALRAPDPGPGAARPRLLLVDPDPGRRRHLAAPLVAADYQVVHAEDAAQTIALVARRRVDLVVLDEALPDLGGLATCRRIRAELAQPLLPLVLCARAPTAALRAAATAAGVDELVASPVDPDELLARLHNLIRLRDHFVASEAERVQHESLARRWRLISAVAEAVATCRDHEALTRALLGALRPVLPIDGAALFEVDHDDLVARAVHLAAPGLGPTVGVRRAWSAPGWLATLRAERILALTAADAVGTPFAPLLSGALTAGAVLPVFTGGDLDGVLLLARTTRFAADELELLAQLTPHVANAIANVRSHLRAVELDAARQRLSTFLVHDLKNPLAVIKLSLDLIGNERLPSAERTGFLGDARTAADTLLAMLVDFLDIARAEEGRLTLDRHEVAVDQLVGELLVPYAAGFRAASVSLLYDAAPALTASLDPKLIRRVVHNLLDNAMRYVGRRGKVEVEVVAEDEDLLIRVGNDGPPIAPALRPHLFDAYGASHGEQGASNRGLGLYFCRLVAHAHEGSIAVADRPGGGVCFEVRLPRRLHRTAP
jgi:signal transduction histidine kinase/CheY-like chemotaxis protein